MSKGNKGFGSQFTAGLDDEDNLDKATPADGIMASRSQTLARLARFEKSSGGEYAQDVANDLRRAMQQHAVRERDGRGGNLAKYCY